MMFVPLTLLTIFLFHVLHPCSAFSTLSCRSGSHLGVSGASHRPFLLSSSMLVPAYEYAFKTSTHLSAINDHNRLLETNQTATNSTRSEEVLEDTAVEGETKKGLFARFRRGGTKFDKASLAKLGGSVLLSYGFVSNVFGITCVSCAWYIASKKSGLSPLVPGQWKGFVAVYAAFFAFLNVIRPARFALSVYISRYFDKALNAIQNRFSCSKPIAVGILVTFNVCFNFAYMFLGIFAASTLAGVPFWSGRV